MTTEFEALTRVEEAVSLNLTKALCGQCEIAGAANTVLGVLNQERENLPPMAGLVLSNLAKRAVEIAATRKYPEPKLEALRRISDFAGEYLNDPKYAAYAA